MNFQVGMHEKLFLVYHRNDMVGVTNSGRLVSNICPRINYHFFLDDRVVHSVFISASVNSRKESKSSSL